MAVLNVPSVFPTIQAAVNAAASGDTILIAPGIYRESVVVPPDKERLRIEGAGPDLTRIHGGGTLDVGMQIGGAFTTVVGLTVIRFRLDGIQATSNNNLFENLVLEQNGRHGIALQPGALRNVVLRVIARRNRATGILAFGEARVLNSQALENGGDGIAVDGPRNLIYQSLARCNGRRGIAVAGDLSLVLENQALDQCACTAGSGIQVLGTRHLLFGNEANRNNQAGIELIGNERTRVVANRVRANRRAGIQVLGGMVNALNLNTATANQFAGINIDNRARSVLVSSNSVRSNSGAGIRLGPSTERIVVQVNEALGNQPDLLNLAPVSSQNLFAANVCQTSSPAGLCGSTANLLRVPTQFPTIQAAVNAAVQGQVILVDPGVYHEAVVIPAGKEAVLIQGAGAGLSILDGDGLRISGFNIQGSSFLTIRGFTIRNYTGSGVEVNTEGNWVDRLELFNPVTLFGDQNLIHLNRFHSTGILTPLLVPTGTSNYLINNSFDQAVSAIRTDFRSQRTLVWRNGLTAIDTIAIELTGEGDLAIENTIDEASLIAIQASNAARGLLLRNQIRGGVSGSRGILAIEAPEIVIMENSVTLTGQGIFALDTGPALIQGNVVNQSNQGIVIGSPNTGIVGDENEATNNETGLLVEAAPGNAFRRNTLCNNTLDLDAALGNTYDLNTCDTSDPPGLCTFGC